MVRGRGRGRANVQQNSAEDIGGEQMCSIAQQQQHQNNNENGDNHNNDRNNENDTFNEHSNETTQETSTLRLVERDRARRFTFASKLAPSQIQESIKLITNVYTLHMKEGAIYRHLRHRKCLLLMKLVLERYRQSTEMAYIYDGSASLFTNESLDLTQIHRTFIEPADLTPELLELLGKSESIRVEITKPTEHETVMSLEDLNLLCHNSKTNENIQSHSLKHFFEIITKQSSLMRGTHNVFGSKTTYLKDGREYGMSDVDLGRGHKLMNGCVKGVRFIESNKGNTSIVPALVLDSKKAVFYDSLPLMELVTKLWTNRTTIEHLGDVSSFWRFNRFITDLIRGIKVHCITQSNKVLRISHLSDCPVGAVSTESFKKNCAIPLKELYGVRGIKVRDDLPAAVVALKNSQIFYPIEVLQVMNGQRVPLNKLSSQQISHIIKLCAVNPNERFTAISRHLKALNLHEGGVHNEYLRAFGVRIASRPVQVNANRVQLPSIVYTQNKQSVVNRDAANWTSSRYVEPAHITEFYLCFDDPNEQITIRKFASRLTESSKRKGVRFAENPSINLVEFDQLEDFIRSLKFHRNDIIFLMYVDNRPNSHEDLKLFELLYQVLTQHVQTKTVHRILKQRQNDTLEGIINKMNIKNCGHNYNVIPPSFGQNKWLTNEKTLVIGYDVSHPHPHTSHEMFSEFVNEQPSVIGFSYNCGRNPETFIGDYAYHEARKEQVTSSILEERIFWILDQFQRMRSVLPEFVFVLRDGVSEEQMIMVMKDEFEAVKDGLAKLCAYRNLNNYEPKFLLAVTTKRHNKRFFVPNASGTVTNPLPGTVIDHTITRADCTEVFMQPHRVIQGSAKLPCYTLLVNEIEMDMDEFQSIMMSLCYTHQIINSAISIPEPIYQADEWAKRGRNNFIAYKRRMNNRLPKLRNGNVDWDQITEHLCYMNKRLHGNRSNA